MISLCEKLTHNRLLHPKGNCELIDVLGRVFSELIEFDSTFVGFVTCWAVEGVPGLDSMLEGLMVWGLVDRMLGTIDVAV